MAGRSKARQKLSPGRPEKGSVNLRKGNAENVVRFPAVDPEIVHVDKEVAKIAGVSPKTASDALTIKSRGTTEDWQDVLGGKASCSS